MSLFRSWPYELLLGWRYTRAGRATRRNGFISFISGVSMLGISLGVAALILAWRLFRHDSIQPAVSGFIGVGLSALIAWVVGASKGYFLLGIWSSLVWAAVFAVSVLIRRPIVGYVWSWVNGHDRAWRNARRAVLAFDIATLTWVLVFGSRFLVQRHLYDADQTGWLGVARIAMGWPLTAVAALVTYLAIRSAQRAIHSAHHHETHEHPAVDQTGDDAVLGTEEN